MIDEISPETFAYLVGLGALELDDTQAEYLRSELNHQLKAIHELEAIPLDENVPISLHGVSYPPEISPALRPDEWQPDSHSDAILGQAPRLADRYIEVPDIPHTTLE